VGKGWTGLCHSGKRLDEWRREEASLETGICLLVGFKLKILDPELC
jgi:hypothetical protein